MKPPIDKNTILFVNLYCDGDHTAEGDTAVGVDIAAFERPGAWGILLADVLRQLVNAYAAEGEDPETAHAEILAFFNAEVESPTGEIHQIGPTIAEA